jgi:hypothetical protein
MAVIDSTGFNIVLVLHLVTVVVGLGTVSLGAVFAAQARRNPGPGVRLLVETQVRMTKLAGWFVLAIPVFGFALVGMSDKVFEFSQTWIWLSLVVWVVVMGVLHGMVLASGRKLLAALDGAGPGAPPAGVAALAQRLAVGTGVLALLTVVGIVLMVWQPGA